MLFGKVLKSIELLRTAGNGLIVRGPDDSRTFDKIRVDEKHFIDSAALRYELAISRL